LESDCTIGPPVVGVWGLRPQRVQGSALAFLCDLPQSLINLPHLGRGCVMNYIDKVIQPGEVILGRTRLHWLIYLRPAFVLLLALGILAAGASASADNKPLFEIGAAVLGIVGLFSFFGAWIKRLTTELAVTDRRVVHKTGFFSRQTQEMNREKVESVDVEQSVLGRIFGYGTVLVRGIGSSWEPFKNIADPLTFRSHITAA
jgi:hypothetical protein